MAPGAELGGNCLPHPEATPCVSALILLSPQPSGQGECAEKEHTIEDTTFYEERGLSDGKCVSGTRETTGERSDRHWEDCRPFALFSVQLSTHSDISTAEEKVLDRS